MSGSRPAVWTADSLGYLDRLGDRLGCSAAEVMAVGGRAVEVAGALGHAEVTVGDVAQAGTEVLARD